MDAHKSMELDGIHPKVLRKLANVVERSFSPLKGCGVRSLHNWKRQISHPCSRRARGWSGELQNSLPNVSPSEGYREKTKITVQKLERIIDLLVGMDVIHGNPDQVEKYTDGNFLNLKEGKVMSGTLGGIIPCNGTVWGLTGWNQPCRGGTWGSHGQIE